MAKVNLLKLILRSLVLLSVALLYWIDGALIESLLYLELGPFQVMHLTWFLLMAEMVFVLIPNLNNQVACGKLFARHFQPVKARDPRVLSDVSRKYNRRALLMVLLWALFLMTVGALYKIRLIKKAVLFLLSLLLYFLDQIFINVWCPLRVWIIKNKCCTTCRIYNWGHLMMFSPLVFIPSFWTLSLVVVAAVILVQWEYQHLLHPHRFYEVTNCKLRCSECQLRCPRNPRNRLYQSLPNQQF